MIEIKYQWKDGFRAPKGVHATEVWEALQALPTFTPEALFEASKSNNHPLHAAIWSEDDQTWATRGRITFCRHIIASIERTEIRGRKVIVTRAAEFVCNRWASVEDIAEDPDLRDAWLADVQRFLEQATAKLESVRLFLKRK